MSQKVAYVYLNGLGDGRLGVLEKHAIRSVKKRQVTIEHLPINWYVDETLSELMERVARRCETIMRQHSRVILVGASAGGSLAVNVFVRMNTPELSVITLCSRLNEVGLAWWDVRSLERMAHIGTRKQSRIFYDSVYYATTVSVPTLTVEQKQRILTVMQWVDETVPRRTMRIPESKSYRMSGVGHSYGIIKALSRIDKIISE